MTPTELSLDDLIKLYAEATCRDLEEMSDETFKRRFDLHRKLADALGVKHTDLVMYFPIGARWMEPSYAEKRIRDSISHCLEREVTQP